VNPLELIDYLVAGTSLLIGIVVGRRMRPRPPKPLTPTCSCTHGFGQHEGGAQCFGKVAEAVRFDGYGTEIAWKQVQCTCLRYDGPSPVIFGLEVP